MLTIQSLKDHVHGWLAAMGHEVGVVEHRVVSSFVLHVEGREAEQDAVELLQRRGYTIIPPPTALPAGPNG